MLTREKLPGSPRFSVLQQTMESWAGPWNKAIGIVVKPARRH